VLCTAAATFLACAAGIVPALRAYRTAVVQGLRPLG
jgi:ABC-type lipoprotein release transport system permease subunit